MSRHNRSLIANYIPAFEQVQIDRRRASYTRCILSASIQLAAIVVHGRLSSIKCLSHQLLICSFAFSKNTNMLSLFSSVFLIYFVILDNAVAKPTLAANQYYIKERHNVPRGWNKIGAVPDSHLIDLHIGLRQNNQGKIEKHIMEASDPYHSSYGQHLSAGEVQKLISPSDETIRMVYTWLTEHGITTARLSASKDWLTASVPVRRVERLLNTTYSVYQHQDGSTLIRAPEWSLPQYLHDLIDLVQPTTSFFRTSKLTSDAMPEKAPIQWHESFEKGWWKAPPQHVSSPQRRSSLWSQATKIGDRIQPPVISAVYAM